MTNKIIKDAADLAEIAKLLRAGVNPRAIGVKPMTMVCELETQLNEWERELLQWKHRLIAARNDAEWQDKANVYRYVSRRIEDMQYHVRKSKEKMEYNKVEFSLER